MCSVCAYDVARLAIKIQSPALAPDYCTSFGVTFCKANDRRCSSCPDIPIRPAIPIAPRTLIAFTGLAGSGKSTAAAHLVNHHGFQRIRFAGPLKAMLAALGCTPTEIDGDRKEAPCELLGGKTPRHAMQTLGTEWGRDLIASDLWIRAFNAALAKMPVGVPVVVDDCRFPNEAEAVKAAGGIVVRIERPGAGASAAGHKSEGQALATVITLCNTGTEADLFELVDQALAIFPHGHRHTAP